MWKWIACVECRKKDEKIARMEKVLKEERDAMVRMKRTLQQLNKHQLEQRRQLDDLREALCYLFYGANTINTVEFTLGFIISLQRSCFFIVLYKTIPDLFFILIIGPAAELTSFK